MVQLRARILTQDEQVAQRHLQIAEPCTALLIGSRAELLRACPQLLDAQCAEGGEKGERIVAQGETLRREPLGTPDAAVREGGDGLRRLYAAPLQLRCDLRTRHGAEGNAHRAGANGRQDGIPCARHEQKEYRRGWLLKRLEQAVRRNLIHAVRIVDEDDTAIRTPRRLTRRDEDVTHRVGTDHSRTLAARLRAHLEVVWMHARRHRTAGIAVPAGRISPCRTEQCPREHARRAAFADALRPREHQGVRQTAVRREMTQAGDDRRMTADVRPVAGERFTLLRCGGDFLRLCHHI